MTGGNNSNKEEEAKEMVTEDKEKEETAVTNEICMDGEDFTVDGKPDVVL